MLKKNYYVKSLGLPNQNDVKWFRQPDIGILWVPKSVSSVSAGHFEPSENPTHSFSCPIGRPDPQATYLCFSRQLNLQLLEACVLPGQSENKASLFVSRIWMCVSLLPSFTLIACWGCKYSSHSCASNGNSAHSDW